MLSFDITAIAYGVYDFRGRKRGPIQSDGISRRKILFDCTGGVYDRVTSCSTLFSSSLWRTHSIRTRYSEHL
jgi:hypothetical protein